MGERKVIHYSIDGRVATGVAIAVEMALLRIGLFSPCAPVL